jgi:hypothetical protein
VTPRNPHSEAIVVYVLREDDGSGDVLAVDERTRTVRHLEADDIKRRDYCETDTGFGLKDSLFAVLAFDDRPDYQKCRD